MYRFKTYLSFLFFILFASICAPTIAHADDGPEDAILILDASGSMWGQIEGENKITIARGVIGQLLKDLPADRRLGLMAYGHNRKGDCSDIEVLAEVGASREVIQAAVKNINPKGKTPISASVKQAANLLKYTENKATVILISDGIETCNLDPCALGKQLEKDGIDFTAHVVGFDIVDKKTEEQLQCLANSTGGRYLSAASAGDLLLALGETVGKKQANSAPAKLHLEATVLVNGPVIESGLNWRVQKTGGGSFVYEGMDKGGVTSTFPPGVYDVFVTRPSDGLTGESRLVELRSGANITVSIALNPEFEASVTPDREAVDSGKEFSVKWTGPDRKSDFITVTQPDASARSYTSYAYTANGNPLVLTAPIRAGDYEVRYVLSHPYKVLARTPITINKSGASVKGPEKAIGGSVITIEWTGPSTKSDYITIVAKDSNPREYLNYFYTKDGVSPHDIQVPVEAGQYEIRYVFVGNDNGSSYGHRVIARQELTVEKAEASIDGPETARTGDTLSIDWTGPTSKGDFVTVTKQDASQRSYTDYKYTANGSPSKLRMPLEPGDYELRVVQKGARAGYKVVASKPIKITQMKASLSGPKTAVVGSDVEIVWAGPSPQSGDFITVTKPDATERTYLDYAYSKNGSPAKISMPVEPGEYELRFVQNNAKVIARQPITLTDISVTLNAPKTAKADTEVSIGFEAKAQRGDWITVVAPNARDTKYGDYFYPRNGSPQNLDMPKEPGMYEIRYVLKGKRVVARQSIEVTN